MRGRIKELLPTPVTVVCQNANNRKKGRTTAMGDGAKELLRWGVETISHSGATPVFFFQKYILDVSDTIYI
jgi:hypothetical protein